MNATPTRCYRQLNRRLLLIWGGLDSSLIDKLMSPANEGETDLP